MAYLFVEAPDDHPTFGLSSEMLLPLIDKYKNVNLYSLQRYHKTSYEDCDGSISNAYHYYVFGATDKMSAMRIFIKNCFPMLDVKKVDKETPVSKYIEKDYEFGEQLIGDVAQFWEISREAITLPRIKSYLLRNANALIFDMTEFLFEVDAGSDPDYYHEEADLEKVVRYMKEQYPKEYDNYYPSSAKSEDYSQYKPLDDFFKEP